MTKGDDDQPESASTLSSGQRQTRPPDDLDSLQGERLMEAGRGGFEAALDEAGFTSYRGAKLRPTEEPEAERTLTPAEAMASVGMRYGRS